PRTTQGSMIMRSVILGFDTLFRCGCSTRAAQVIPAPLSGPISPSAAAIGRIPRFLSVSASTRAGTAGLAAAPSCREACVGSLTSLHVLCAQRSFLQVLVKESHGLFDGFGPFFDPVRRAVAFAFDDDGLGGHPGGLELLGHVRRVSLRHQFILGAMEEQERRR